LRPIICSHQNLVDFCGRVIENWFTPETGARKKDQRPNYKPLKVWTKKKKEKYPVVTMEKRSGFIILAGFFGIFVYMAIYNSYFHQWYQEHIQAVQKPQITE